MSKIVVDTPKPVNQWLNESLSANELGSCRQAFCKLLRYRGIAVKDAKIDLDLVKNVVFFMGVDSQKWRNVAPQSMKFSLKSIDSIYRSLQHFA
jgi:hypothetical protein